MKSIGKHKNSLLIKGLIHSKLPVLSPLYGFGFMVCIDLVTCLDLVTLFLLTKSVTKSRIDCIRQGRKRFHPTRIENLKSPTLLAARAMQHSIAAQRDFSMELAGNSNFYLRNSAFS